MNLAPSKMRNITKVNITDSIEQPHFMYIVYTNGCRQKDQKKGSVLRVSQNKNVTCDLYS